MTAQYADARHIGWSCPHCGCANIDDFIRTATLPICKRCRQPTKWEDILTHDQHADAIDALATHQKTYA